MAKKKHQHIKKNSKDASVQAVQLESIADKGFSFWTKKSKLYLLIALIATAFAYSGSLTNGLIPNWDDGGYIIEDLNVHHLTIPNLENIWSTFYKGNYHPLTTTFYALEYSLVKESPFLYHFNNLVIHLLDVFLVFFLIQLLAKGRTEVSFFTALFFGIHPMHVESVAWISERKDVLYTFFFLISLISYYYYAFKNKTEGRFLYFGILFFSLSMLSKSAAVILPLVMVLIDLFQDRNYSLNRSQLRSSTYVNILSFIIVIVSFWLNKKDPATDASAKTNMASMILWFMTIGFSAFSVVLSIIFFRKNEFKGNFILTNIIEKSGFFMMALVFGILAILSQGEAHAIQDLTPLFNIPERLMLASYATMTYISKMFVPINLMPMYAYPDRIGGHLPLIYQLAPLFVIALAAFVWCSWRKTKVVFFGVIWFFITIILVIQLLPVGGAILSERYTYVPYIGLFFIIGSGLDWVIINKEQLKPLVYAFVILSSIIFMYITFDRVKVWEKGDKLFIDLAEKNPQLPFAYNNLGYYYYKWGKENDKAIFYFNKCLAIDPKNEGALTNRGVLYFNVNKFKEALEDFTNSLKQRQDKGDPWIGRANTYSTLQMFKEAIPDYNRYLKIKPEDTSAYLWRGIAYFRTMKYDSSIADIDYFLKRKPNNDEAYYFRGFDYYNQGNYAQALNDFESAIRMNPKRTDLFNYLGLVKHQLKQYNEALEYFNKAIQIKPDIAEVYVNRSKIYYALGKYLQALKDMQTAGNMRLPLDRNYYLTLVRLTGQGM